MRTTDSNKKKHRMRVLRIIGHIVGTASTIILFGFIIWTIVDIPKEVTPSQVREELIKDDTKAPKDVVVHATIKNIHEVPLYGYSYNIGSGIFIVNFDRLPFKVGDSIDFRILGVMKLKDIYIVNVDFQ
jgi:hypothetical protein